MVTTISRAPVILMVSKLQRTLQECLNHKQQRRDNKQQRRDKWGTQLNKSTTQKMTKMRLTTFQQLQGWTKNNDQVKTLCDRWKIKNTKFD